MILIRRLIAFDHVDREEVHELIEKLESKLQTQLFERDSGMVVFQYADEYGPRMDKHCVYLRVTVSPEEICG